MSQTILNPAITEYLFELEQAQLRENIFTAMEAYAAKEKFPIVGPLVGRFFSIIAHAIGAKRVFEFGSGFGYSASWFANGIGKNGNIICVDGDKENVERAERYLTEAGVWENISFHVGRAQDVFLKTDGEFDVIYNDADKNQYPEIFEMSWKRVRKGGFYIADNTLWFGRVVEKKVTDDPYPGWTESIKKHNRLIFEHPAFETSIIPLRDGVVIARRK